MMPFHSSSSTSKQLKIRQTQYWPPKSAQCHGNEGQRNDTSTWLSSAIWANDLYRVNITVTWVLTSYALLTYSVSSLPSVSRLMPDALPEGTVSDVMIRNRSNSFTRTPYRCNGLIGVIADQLLLSVQGTFVLWYWLIGIGFRSPLGNEVQNDAPEKGGGQNLPSPRCHLNSL